MNSPCYKNGVSCTERTSTCHTKCESYIKWQEQKRKESEELFLKKYAHNQHNKFFKEHKKRIEKRRGVFKFQGGKK